MSSSNGSTNDVTIGVVGDGFGALLVYSAAVYLGFRPDQVGMFGKNTVPTSTYQQFAWNLGQTVLRSEAESQFLPADWPTFSQVDAYARRDLSPLFRSAGRKYNPGVPEIMAEADDRRRPARLRRPRPRRHARRLGRPRARAADALLALRRGRPAARPRQARDARHGPRAARVPGRLRQGAREPRR